jgi:tetratricopeptide (TPR) repeat protein
MIAINPLDTKMLEEAKDRLLHLGFYEDIQKIDQYMMRIIPIYEQTLLDADISYAKKDYKTAIRIYEQILQQSPQNKLVTFALANAYEHDSQHELALHIYLEAQLSIQEKHELDTNPLSIHIDITDQPYLDYYALDKLYEQTTINAARKQQGEAIRAYEMSLDSITPSDGTEIDNERYNQERNDRNIKATMRKQDIYENTYKNVYEACQEQKHALQVSQRNLYEETHPGSSHLSYEEFGEEIAYPAYEEAYRKALEQQRQARRQRSKDLLLQPADNNPGKSKLEVLFAENLKKDPLLLHKT